LRVARLNGLGDRLHDQRRRAELAGRMGQRQRILRKTRAPEPRTRVQEFRADAIVEADAARHVLDIRSSRLAETRHFVDETDFGREIGISLSTVRRSWDAHRLQPLRLCTLKRSNDPEFAEKVEDVVGRAPQSGRGNWRWRNVVAHVKALI
jgi:hypothetical protein